MDVQFSLPETFRERIEAVLASDGFESTDDYLREVVEQDLAERAHANASPGYIRWLKAELDKGRASGIIDKDPREVIEEIIAERRARRG